MPRCFAWTPSPTRSSRRRTSASGCAGWRDSPSRPRRISRSGGCAARTRRTTTRSRHSPCSTIAAAELEALIVAEERALRRAEACLPLRRATTRELQWLLRRAATRGVAEPRLDNHWEPAALIVEANGRPAYEPLSSDLVRHVN